MAETHVTHYEQRREGMLGYSEGCYMLLWRPHPEILLDVMVHPLQVGDRFEAQMGGQWQVAMMCSGGYRGSYLLLPNGQHVRPALCMRARMLV